MEGSHFQPLDFIFNLNLFDQALYSAPDSVVSSNLHSCFYDQHWSEDTEKFEEHEQGNDDFALINSQITTSFGFTHDISEYTSQKFQLENAPKEEILASISMHKKEEQYGPYITECSNVEFADNSTPKNTIGVGKRRQIVCKILQHFGCSFVQVSLISNGGMAFRVTKKELDDVPNTKIKLAVKNGKVTCYLIPFSRASKFKTSRHTICFDFMDSKENILLGKQTFSISNLFWGGRRHELTAQKAIEYYASHQNSCLKIIKSGDNYSSCVSKFV